MVAGGECRLSAMTADDWTVAIGGHAAIVAQLLHDRWKADYSSSHDRLGSGSNRAMNVGTNAAQGDIMQHNTDHSCWHDARTCFYDNGS